MRKIMLWAITASLTFSGVALANNRSNRSRPAIIATSE